MTLSCPRQAVLCAPCGLLSLPARWKKIVREFNPALPRILAQMAATAQDEEARTARADWEQRIYRRLTDTSDAIRDADIVALLTDHACFRAIPRTTLADKIIYDTRGLWT